LLFSERVAKIGSGVLIAKKGCIKYKNKNPELVSTSSGSII
jgi:hypothetical protein